MILRKHRHDRDFTIIENDSIRDGRLSWKATGLLCFLLSLPDDWQVDGRHLAKQKKDGRDATYGAMKELEQAGYIVREKRHGDHGRIETLVHVYEVPRASGKSATDSGFPGPGEPGTGGAGAEEEPLTKDGDEGEHPSPPAAAKPEDLLLVAAREIVKDWWEVTTPRPAQNFVGVVKIVQKMLKAGWSPQSLRWALGQAPTPSVGALEFALRKSRAGSSAQVQSAAAEYLGRRNGNGADQPVEEPVG